MNKNILWIFGLILAASFSFVACSESNDDVDPYANWDSRNQNYIDSIAKVARANEGINVGQWKIIYSYKLPDLGIGQTGGTNDYVYCKIKESGNGATPIFTDTVYVNYRGKLINGTVFDQSYRGTYDPATAIPVKFNVGAVITGWTTALQQMKVGDEWEIYIPYNLAYGSSASNSIPGYSTLIFDVALMKVLPLKGKE